MRDTYWEDGVEYDEGGLPVHLKMGFTVDGQGPVSEDEPDFSFYGCWCGTPGCEMYK